jgi:hypothetical protein
MSSTLLPPKPSAFRGFECGFSQLLFAALTVLGLGLVAAQTPAEKYLVSGPFRIIAPLPPGGPLDRIPFAGLYANAADAIPSSAPQVPVNAEFYL